MPDFPVLAGTGIEPAGVAEDGEVLSGHRERAVDSHRVGPGAGAGDAGGTSGVIQVDGVHAETETTVPAFRRCYESGEARLIPPSLD